MGRLTEAFFTLNPNLNEFKHQSARTYHVSRDKENRITKLTIKSEQQRSS